MKLLRTSACLLAAALLLPGCTMLTTQGRQERAYAHYVKKMSAGRAKQQKRFASKGNKLPPLPTSEPIMTNEASGPESVGDGSGANGDNGAQ